MKKKKWEDEGEEDEMMMKMVDLTMMEVVVDS